MNTKLNSKAVRTLITMAVLIPVLLAAGTALADDDERMEKARAALNEAKYQRAAELYEQARIQAQVERTAAEALYWEAFARYRTDKTRELKVALALLEQYEVEYAEAEYAEQEELVAEAEALAARVSGELAKRGEYEAARDVYGKASEEQQRLETRIAALHALSQMDPDRALPILEKILRDENTHPELRQNAMFMLCQTDDRGIDILIDMLPTLEDEEMLQVAVMCLANSDDERSYDVLVDLLKRTDDDELASMVLMSLGQHDDERAFNLLAEIARDETRGAELRSHAILGLMHSDRDETAVVLLDIIEGEKNEEVFETALMALAQTDSPRAAEALLKIARDPDLDDELRTQALFMAGVHGQVEAGTLKEIYRTTDSRDMKVQICHVLTQLDDSEAGFEALMEILETETDPEIRNEAVFWIGQFDDPRAADYLLKIINEE